MKILFSFVLLIYSLPTFSQSYKIGIIEVYGNRKVKENKIRSQLGINVGDSIQPSIFDKEAIIKRLQRIPGVKDARITFVCCDDTHGEFMMFAGISESAKTLFTYNRPPAQHISLPAEITDTYHAYSDAFMTAVQKGNNGEDRSLGYSLMYDSATRQQQQQFLFYAGKYFPELKSVLHNASDPSQRSIAAMVIAYARDKDKIATELLKAIHDNDEDTRNNATRALAVLLQAAQKNPALLQSKIPVEPFIDMINSVVWTDRNKALAVLEPLTQSKDSLVVITLRKKALSSLLEMAAWKNPSHSYYAYLITGRIAGLSDDEITKAFNSDNRDSFLQKMISLISDLP